MSKKLTIYHICILLTGLGLIGLSFFGNTDEFWSGMGSALTVLGIVRLLRDFRLSKNTAYREKVEIEQSDERNKFLHEKAWVWSGYLFVLIAAIAVIIFKLAGQELLSLAASWAVCLILILYWSAYWILRKKY